MSNIDVKRLILFPTFVYSIDSQMFSPHIDNNKLNEWIVKKSHKEESVHYSNVGGWQSQPNLHYDKIIQPLIMFISTIMKNILKEIGYKDSISSYLSDLWGNINKYKDYNSNHAHLPADWSFCYYTQVPEPNGKIYFKDARIKNIPKKHMFKNFDNHFTHIDYFIAPTVGQLLIFPGYLEHHVNPNLSQIPRISFSGNIICK